MDSTTERLILAAGGDFTVDQVEYTTPGTYSLTVPPNVTNVSIVTVQGGQGGGSSGGDGGALRYLNNVAVTPNEILTIFVGAGGAGVAYTTSSTTKGAIGAHSSVSRGTTTLLSSGAAIGTGFSGGVGGAGNNPNGGGGGGAAGYAGNGGNGAGATATAGTGGGGGGGGLTTSPMDLGSWYVGRLGGSGGGVALKGQGANGTAAANNSSDPALGSNSGGGGSGAAPAAGCGAGGGGGYATITKSDGSTTYSKGSDGGPGGVRIIWPGNVRQFPSIRTADE